MKKEIRLCKHNVTLRPAGIEDSELILRLRTDSRLSTFLGRLEGDLASQISWMKEYLRKENEYYYIIEYRNISVGTISIYNHLLTPSGLLEAEWGRWVIDQRYPVGPISAQCLFEIGFDLLGYDLLYCQTVFSNRSVVAFHDSYAIRTSNRQSSLIINGEKQNVVFHEISKKHWKNVERKINSTSMLCCASLVSHEGGEAN